MVIKIHGGIINKQVLTGSIRYFQVNRGEPTTEFNNTIADGNQQAIGAVVVAGGTGYTPGDTLTATTGTGSQATYTVVEITGGGATGPVASVSVLSGGDYSVLPTEPIVTTGGTGSGATLDATYTSFIIIPGAGIPGGSEFFVSPGAPVPGSAVDQILGVISERADIVQVAVTSGTLLQVAVANTGFAWDINDDGDAAAEMQTAIRALGAAVIVPDNTVDGLSVDLSGVLVTESVFNNGFI